MIAAAIAKHLAATVTGLSYTPTTTGGNVFLAHMPSTPDVAVAVMPTGGGREASRLPHDSPTVQVIVRGTIRAYRASHELAVTILGELACLDNVTLDDGGPDEVWLVGATPAQSAPVPMGADSNDRPEWSLNLELQVHHPSTHRPAYT